MAEICMSDMVRRFLDLKDLHTARAVCWDWYSAFGSRDVEKECVRSNGLPKSHRFKYWMAHSQADVMMRCGGGLATYRSCLAKSKFQSSGTSVSWFTLSQQPGLEGEIARDVTRTFPQRILFRVKNGLGREMLFNILVALAVYEPKVGYCQGMNFVVAVALIVALDLECPSHDLDEMAIATNGIPRESQEEIESQVFWLMVAFLHRFDMKELWRPGVPQLKLRIYQFDRLISSKLPSMHAYFRSIGLAPDFFASQWFLTLMSYNMEIEQLVRVWDVLIIEGWKTIFKTGLAILTVCEEEIMSMSLEKLSMYFRHSNSMHLSNEQALEHAFHVKISTHELADLESDFITHMLFKRMKSSGPDEKTPKTNITIDSNEGVVPHAYPDDDDVFVDHRLATIFKEQIEDLDSEARKDVEYLRGKIEEAEKAYQVKETEFEKVAQDYKDKKTTLDELEAQKTNLSKMLMPTEQDQEKIKSIYAHIESVSKKVEIALWKTSQAQVEMEEIIEKKKAFSDQLRSVLNQNEQLKSQAIKGLWNRLSI